LRDPDRTAGREADEETGLLRRRVAELVADEFRRQDPADALDAAGPQLGQSPGIVAIKIRRSL